MLRSVLLLMLLVCAVAGPLSAAPLKLTVRYAAGKEAAGPLDGRLLLMLSAADAADIAEEPRFQISDGPETQLIFGIDVDGWKAGQDAVFDAGVLGYPLHSLSDVPPGTYRVQALLHKYETFHRADGHTVKLPMDRGEGQQWNRAPGNLYSTPQTITIPATGGTFAIHLDQVIPPIPDPPATKYIRHETIQSDLLTRFWGRPMHLGAHVLLPWGFDEHPNAHYPLVIFHSHFPRTFGGFREEPPDSDHEARAQQAVQLAGLQPHRAGVRLQALQGLDRPRTSRASSSSRSQHANPYYDDSYAVNSANLGPYGDAITHELIPYLEKKYRGLGAGWARFLYGGSTGGWEALAAQVFYPDDYNGAWASCPDPIDFRAYTTVNIYEDKNAYYLDSRWKRTPRPGQRDYLGHVSTTIEDQNRLELVLGTNSRSGGQWDIWQAVFSPVGPDGYPKPIWDKKTGVIDPQVAAYWREHYDLSAILQRDWKTLGPKLAGKINLYVGDMDNYYLNNAVYLMEDFLKQTANPPYGGEVKYGDRFEHCWNGDPDQPNAISRLRYHQMYAPKILERILKSAPAGADLTSWRY